MKHFIDYAFNGDVIGKSVSTINNAYVVYCKLFDIDPLDEVVNRICNEFNLFIENGKVIQ